MLPKGEYSKKIGCKYLFLYICVGKKEKRIAKIIKNNPFAFSPKQMYKIYGIIKRVI